MTDNQIIVGMADLQTGRGNIKLATLGLGSCVGITLFDAATKVGGMAHAMLPSCTITGDDQNKAKYADTAINELLKRVLAQGANRSTLVAKLAGGAHMFNRAVKKDVIQIGLRNAEASKQTLRQLNIPIRAIDVGGNFGRTIILNLENGELLVRTLGHGEKII